MQSHGTIGESISVMGGATKTKVSKGAEPVYASTPVYRE
jgi:hypothetical protein